MRVGATLINQNYTDWDRYEAEERGEEVPARPRKRDSEVFNEEINIARIADETGFDSLWTIEHHFTPYTMVTNPMQYLTYIAVITERVDLAAVMTMAQAGNRDIAATESAVAAGQEQVGIAKAQLLPQIGVGLDASLIDKDTAEFFPTTSELKLVGVPSAMVPVPL